MGDDSYVEDNVTINQKWLQNQCKALYEDEERGNETSQIIMNLLKEKKDDEVSLQSGLFDILGEKGFDLMSKILSNKDKLILVGLKSDLYHIGGHVSKKSASNISITTSRIQQLEKDIRKQELKVLKMKVKSTDDHLTAAERKEVEYLHCTESSITQ